MATQIAVNVYRFGKDGLKNPGILPQRYSFPTSGYIAYPTTNDGLGILIGAIRIYSWIELRPTGSNNNRYIYGVIETVAQLATAAG